MSPKIDAWKKLKLLRKKHRDEVDVDDFEGDKEADEVYPSAPKTTILRLSLTLEANQIPFAACTSCSSRDYVRFRKTSHSHRSPASGQLNCHDHPFFEGLRRFPSELNYSLTK